MTGVAGPSAWTALPDRARAFLADEGGGAYADARLLGFDIGRARPDHGPGHAPDR